ncbi:hypothetical protein OESDEN_23255, partial [Oesophagostomum dentatum]
LTGIVDGVKWVFHLLRCFLVNSSICFGLYNGQFQDDIIDDAQSFVAAAEVLKTRGAYKIYVIATHGVLSSDAPALLEASPITQVIVTNTVPHEVQKMRCHKIKTVDISLMLCEAIRRIYHNESMGQLFRDITLDD